MSTVVAILLVLVTVGLVAGLAWRVVLWLAAPVPLSIPTMPAPLTHGGAALRVGREMFLFHSLFRADKALWVASMAFHLGLALVLLRHLRYVVAVPPAWLVAIQPAGKLAGWMMLAGLLSLLARRLFIPRVRMLTRAGDNALLILLLSIGASGLVTTYLLHTDILAVKTFLSSIWRAAPEALPPAPVFLLHLLLAAVLLAIAPFSKLLHAPGLVFSPTRNQPDGSRRYRRPARWARKLAGTGP
jgi:nitrate reductase gamma subunit